MPIALTSHDFCLDRLTVKNGKLPTCYADSDIHAWGTCFTLA